MFSTYHSEGHPTCDFFAYVTVRTVSHTPALGNDTGGRGLWKKMQVNVPAKQTDSGNKQ